MTYDNDIFNEIYVLQFFIKKIIKNIFKKNE